MAGANLNNWVKCTIAMLHKTDLTSKTVALTNRIAIEDVNPLSWPLISDISRVGIASDRDGMINTSGEIRVIDSIGSFGVERKFSDLLQRYAIQDQEITIQYDTTDSGDYYPGGHSTLFTGKIQDWRLNPDSDSPTISIRFKSKTYNNRFITKKITSTDFPSAPSREYFKTLPIVLGSDIQVRPIQISADNSTTPSYAYATTQGSQFVNGGLSTIYCKDYDGNYRQIQSASAVGTAVFENTAASTRNNAINDGAGAPVEAACYVEHDPTLNNFLVTQIALKFIGSGAGTYVGTFTLRLWEAVNNGRGTPPGRVLAESTLNVPQFDTSLDTASAFFIPFPLSRAVVLAGSQDYWISIRHDASGASPQVLCQGSTSATGALRFTRTTGEWGAGSSGTGTRWLFQMYGVKFTDTTTPSGGEINSEGKGHSYFTLTQQSSSYAERPVPLLSELDFLCSVNGLKDDTSGTITSVPSAQLTATRWAINALEREWTGSTWAASGDWDFTIYSGTRAVAEDSAHPLYRTLQGATVGDTTFDQWLREVCRNTAAKPTLQRNGKIGLYYWGATFSSVKTLTQENSKVVRVTALDTGYVLNRVAVAYYKRIMNPWAGAVWSILGGEKVADNYSSVLVWYDTNGSAPGIDQFIGESVTLYGTKTNALQYFDWLYDQRSAETIIKYLLTNYNEPPIYVDVEIPLAVYDTFTSGELMNIVELKHPALPCFFGSSPNTKLPHFNGTECDLSGYNLTRAARYRAQVEAAYIDFSDRLIPTVTLTTRLLLNDNDPT